MLNTLRAKPDHTKQIIALVLTIIIFVGIVFVWVSSFDARTRGQETREKTVSPFTGFKTMIDGFVSEIQSGISSAPSYVENVSATATSTATSSHSFDTSGIVIIDTSSSTTSHATTSVSR